VLFVIGCERGIGGREIGDIRIEGGTGVSCWQEQRGTLFSYV
jgi:hypothetical protein